MKIEISIKKLNIGILMSLRGDVDMNTSPEFRSHLADVFRCDIADSKVILIDLSQVRYMDSSGIATLVEALQTCIKQGVRLRLVSLSQSVRDIFELARLSSVFEIFPSAPDAVAGLA